MSHCLSLGGSELPLAGGSARAGALERDVNLTIPRMRASLILVFVECPFGKERLIRALVAHQAAAGDQFEGKSLVSIVEPGGVSAC